MEKLHSIEGDEEMSSEGDGGMSDDRNEGLKGDRLLRFLENFGESEFQVEREKEILYEITFATNFL